MIRAELSLDDARKRSLNDETEESRDDARKQRQALGEIFALRDIGAAQKRRAGMPKQVSELRVFNLLTSSRSSHT